MIQRHSLRRACGFAWLAAGLLAASLASRCLAAGGALKEGDFVAVCGDSITEQKLYSLFIEEYLLMCRPAPGLRAAQFGWGGETAGGFAARMENDTLPFAPTVATTCYGMNDGGYGPLDPNRAKWYRDSQHKVVQTLKQAGVRLIVVGSPGVVDADAFRTSPEAAVVYNKTLAAERDMAREVAEQEGVTFANVFDPMMDAMTKAKAKYGAKYHLAGPDGVHPRPNGHLVMAYAFLKALGCDGNLGTLTVDLGANKATATEGHKVLSCQGGAVEVESARYPFCFFGDPASPEATRGVIEFLPFNEELNRLRLVVTGTAAPRLKVTWGEASKEFAAADLAKGINLAAEFLDNPFSGAFAKVEQKLREKQATETWAVKESLHGMIGMRRLLPDEKEASDRLAGALVRKLKAQCDAAPALVEPVKHTLKIEEIKG